jgi:dipeptidyl aminopeptidase/acylaminoacyl peptidase
MHRTITALLAVCSVTGCGKKSALPPASPATATVALAPDLLTARKGFESLIRLPADRPPARRPVRPPEGTFREVKYTSPAGELLAYLTPDPGDGRKRPAVLWAHPDAFRLDGDTWGDEHPVGVFRQAGLVVLVPTWRGQDGNPGRFELCYGEVNDLLAARDFLAAQPQVDPARIHLAGPVLGGTLVLLAATATDQFRGAVAFSGWPDLTAMPIGIGELGQPPFDLKRRGELDHRSAANYVRAIRRPTVQIDFGPRDGRLGIHEAGADMQRQAERFGVPFRTLTVPGLDPTDIPPDVSRLLADKFRADPAVPFSLTADELEAQ